MTLYIVLGEDQKAASMIIRVVVSVMCHLQLFKFDRQHPKGAPIQEGVTLLSFHLSRLAVRSCVRGFKISEILRIGKVIADYFC
jgi:hypothetical protein